MEHLPLPQGFEHFITVPYEAPKTNWYDNGGFIDFPQRCGWTEEQLRGGDDTTTEDYLDKNGFHTKGKDSEVEQFFQTWLFFGMVIEFMKLGGVVVTAEDFLVKNGQDSEDKNLPKMVNTSKLPDLVVKWQKGMTKLGVNPKRSWSFLNAMFERSKSILDRFCAPRNNESTPLSQEKPRPWPVREEIATTIIALTFSLRRAAVVHLQLGVGEDGIDLSTPWLNARSEILWKRLQKKWCFADVTTAFKELAIDGHYYLSASPGMENEDLDHHSRCVSEHCRYEYDSNMYVTKHTGAPWHTEECKSIIKYGGQLGPERGQADWVDAIGRIIDKKAIPIALWLKGRRELWSVEYHLEGHRKPDYVAISHVWADGKGNPEANSLPECQLDRITHLVEDLHWKGRKPVPQNPNLSDGIGFWMDTLCVPVANKKQKKDAIASMHDIYTNAKAVLVLDDWLQKIRSDSPMLDIVTRLYQSNWIKRLWTHQEGFLPKNEVYVQFIDKAVSLDDLSTQFQSYQAQEEALGIYLQFPMATSLRLLALYSSLRHIMQGVTDLNKKWMLYAPVADAMSERKTSRLADEVVCLATIIDINVRQFLDLPDKPDAELANDRMALFLKGLHTFQMSLVFNNYERLNQTGYKWAPKSLLNFRTARLLYGSDRRTTVLQPVHGRLGLLVQYPGFLLTFASGKPSFATTERGCVIKCTQSTKRGAKGKYFIIELPPNKFRWEESSTQVYAVVLLSIPEERGRRSRAIIGLSKSRAVGGVYNFDHCSTATVRVEDAPPAWVDTVEAPLLGGNTEWLIM